MKRHLMMLPVVPVVLLLWMGVGFSAGREQPAAGGKTVVATVNGEPITMQEVTREIVSLHEGLTDNVASSRSNPSELLDRIIETRLILQEARNIGLDELPEVQSAVDRFQRDTLRSMLFGNQVRNIRNPAKEEVQKRYRAAVKEVKVDSLYLEKEDDAKNVESGIRAGGDFSSLAVSMVEQGKGKHSVPEEYVRLGALAPQVKEAVSSLKKGGISGPIPIGGGFAILRLVDSRIPEDPAAKKKAEQEALQAKKLAVLKKYTKGLVKQYANVNQELFKGLDYESSTPGLDLLLNDERVLAELKGGAPVKVKDLSDALRQKFYHGAEGAARKHRINRRKEEILQELLLKRIIPIEAKRLKMDKTERYRSAVRQYRNAVLFGTFIRKVIYPDIRVEEEELKKYLQSHIGEYMSPEKMQINSIAFSRKEDAEDAIGKLRKGSDFEWVRANSKGWSQQPEGEGILKFGEGLVTIDSLPEDVRTVVSGARSGDYRFYSAEGGPYYVLQIRQVVPPKPEAYEAVQTRIAQRVQGEKLRDAIREWMKKLRKASDVKIFAASEELKRSIELQAR